MAKRTILVTTDFSEESAKAFDFAKLYAQIYGDAEFVLLTVLEDIASPTIDFEFGVSLFSSEEFQKEIKEEAQKNLQQIADRYFEGLPIRVRLSSETTDIAQQIKKVALEEKADLLVIATHGRTGVRRLLMGSVAESVVRRGVCPTLVVPCETEVSACLSEPLSVLVTTDFSDAARRAYPLAKSLAQATGPEKGHFTLLHMVDDITRGTFGFALGAQTKEIKQELREKYEEIIAKEWSLHFPNSLVETVVLDADGATDQAIVKYAESHNIGLLIIASQGKSAVAEAFLGSVVERTLRLSPCPLLVAP